MGSPYTNNVKNKECPQCGLYFKGDETVKGELCPNCEFTRLFCDSCGKEYWLSNWHTNEKHCQDCDE